MIKTIKPVCTALSQKAVVGFSKLFGQNVMFTEIILSKKNDMCTCL